jgi:predicted amino acid racemase
MAAVLRVDRKAIGKNFEIVCNMAKTQGVQLSVVTKGECGYSWLSDLVQKRGLDSICESRVSALERVATEPWLREKWLIGSPLLSEVDQSIRLADVSLNTEMRLVQALATAAQRMGRVHKVVVMAELGELREGVMAADLVPFCEQVEELPGVVLHGIGTNLSCMNGVLPASANMIDLTNAVADVERAVGRKLDVVSLGGSSAVRLLEEANLPAVVNHLRIGEAVLNGFVPGFDEPLRNGDMGAFVLSGEVVEARYKPAQAWGEGAGEPHPSSVVRKRVIVALGYEDTDLRDSYPYDERAVVCGATSDRTVIDVSDCERDIQVGDVMRFALGYQAMVRALRAPTVAVIDES